MKQDSADLFLEEIERRLSETGKGRIPFSEFLEEKMDKYDYSNTSLAKKVFHRVERGGAAQYLPVTRQTIGAWLKGSMPSSREIYITLGMAFSMSLEEINYILLETYMGYGLYCKNIEDALWIALVNGLFPIEEMEEVKAKIEEILNEPSDGEARSLATTDLWVMLSEAQSMEELCRLFRVYRSEFLGGARQFGQCLEEVIEEEYGYYEKAAWLLRDIGCLHCEAQFSKIKAGKAIVTREWLLRFCIALQPSYESIEKLLAKAQMEPLGITPAEIILEMISRYKSDSFANAQEIWLMMESVTQELREKGYEIDEALCRKYDSVHELPAAQRWWISLGVGSQLLINHRRKDYGYEKSGYCRHTTVDQVLFDDINRCKKNAAFKRDAKGWFGAARPEEEPVYAELPSLSIDKTKQPDVLDLEKFEDYCYMRKPNRFSKEFEMNDVYYYSALLYSIWTGKCYRKDYDVQMEEELCGEFARENLDGGALLSILRHNLSADAAFRADCNLKNVMDALWKLGNSANASEKTEKESR